jgi:hypothetical protein
MGQDLDANFVREGIQVLTEAVMEMDVSQQHLRHLVAGKDEQLAQHQRYRPLIHPLLPDNLCMHPAETDS